MKVLLNSTIDLGKTFALIAFAPLCFVAYCEYLALCVPSTDSQSILEISGMFMGVGIALALAGGGQILQERKYLSLAEPIYYRLFWGGIACCALSTLLLLYI